MIVHTANSSYNITPSSNDSYCNATLYPYVYNLTSSYADKRNEGTMVATTVMMFILAVFFFNLNLFSRLSDLSAILNPTARFFLSTALTLFLPVMSYLFSEAKKEGEPCGSGSSPAVPTELSLRARTILMWMLLVELLRKKAEAILVNVGVQGYSSAIDRAARIAWLGYLVFYNLRSAGKRTIYGTLWVLAAAKLMQRVVINEVFNRSFAYGKNNAQLLSSYMAQMLHEQEQQAGNVRDEGSELLKRCKYAVMGEDNLEREAGPQGYHLELTLIADTVVTVGDIWKVADTENGGLLKEDPRLRRLCLSFALYKLLRRRLEDLPITDAETRNCRDLIFKGLCKEQPRAEVALFRVLQDELQFLCEYYHSVLPVTLSDPFFFLANYIMFPIIVWGFCLVTFIACSNGDLIYAFQSIKSDNYIISTGTMNVAGCLLKRILQSPQALFSTVDLGITLLLMLTFIFEQVWEFVVFILSNWLMVSLLCEYTTKPHWRQSRILSGTIRCILWVRSKMSRPNLCFKQFSVLGFCPLSMLSPFTVPTKAVPKEVKKSILEYLLAHTEGYGINGHVNTLSNGWSTLQSEKHSQWQCRSQLSSACENNSVAEVILTWHIATSLLEVKYPLQKKTPMGAHRKVATTLSGYCAYLVALYPELLPDSKEGTERVYKDMKEEMKKVLRGCWRYHVSRQGARCDKLIKLAEGQEDTTVLQKGAKLGKTLMERKMARRQEEQNSFIPPGRTVRSGPASDTSLPEEDAWELLADLWTELMVYVAPSGSELHVKAHKEALAHGGEFITVLWAVCTHTGITRPPVAPWEAARSASQP